VTEIAEGSSSTWQTSSVCSYGNCVEVRFLDGSVVLRSTRRPDIQVEFTGTEWTTFIRAARAGEFDPPTPAGDACPDEK
jgi:Domain of unknown function (DUF397)